MENLLLIRLAWTAAIIAAGIGLYLLINRLILARSPRRPALHAGIQPGRPGILYFTTPDCAPCKTVQRPALLRLRERLGDSLQIVEINAMDQPELARAWHVLSVPTTFIIDARGEPRHVNHGVAGADKLLQQLDQMNRNYLKS